MVPASIDALLCPPSNYDLFQPLELLGGKSLCDFYIFFPEELSRRLARIPTQSHFEQSLGEIICNEFYTDQLVQFARAKGF